MRDVLLLLRNGTLHRGGRSLTESLLTPEACNIDQGKVQTEYLDEDAARADAKRVCKRCFPA